MLLGASTARAAGPGPAGSADLPACRVAITPDNARLVYESLQGAQADDGCSVEGVTTRQFELVARWRRATGKPIEVRFIPGTCTSQRNRAGLRLEWAGDRGLRAACPATHARVARLRRHLQLLDIDEPRAGPQSVQELHQRLDVGLDPAIDRQLAVYPAIDRRFRSS